MNLYKQDKPEFANGKIQFYNDTKHVIKQISLVKVMIEYPQKLLGTIELLRVELFDENNNLICNDNDIINHSVYHTKKAIIDDLVEKYKINPSVIEIID